MLKIGIAGQRGIAFATALRALPGVELTALCDTDPITLVRQADSLTIAHRFSRLMDMVEAVDAVVISTPMHLHAAQSIAVMRAGKHVLSEVTACVSLEECWRLRGRGGNRRPAGCRVCNGGKLLLHEKQCSHPGNGSQGVVRRPVFRRRGIPA